MYNYIFPPTLNLLDSSVEPYEFFFFEFKHSLTQRDINNIWQNLAPEITSKFETQTVVDSKEVQVENSFFTSPNLKWMVFKVKRRALSSLDTLLTNSALEHKNNQLNKSKNLFKGNADANSKTPKSADEYAHYNWPYDYFSLVEMANVDVTCELQNRTALLEMREGSNQISYNTEGNDE